MFDCGALCVTAAPGTSPGGNPEVLNTVLNKCEKAIVQVFLKTQHNRTTLVYMCYFLLQRVCLLLLCQWKEQQDKTKKKYKKKKTFKASFEFWKCSMVRINRNLRRQKNGFAIPNAHLRYSCFLFVKVI